jgi:hypothetical protein
MDNLNKHKINKPSGGKLKFSSNGNIVRKFDKNKKVGSLLSES